MAGTDCLSVPRWSGLSANFTNCSPTLLGVVPEHTLEGGALVPEPTVDVDSRDETPRLSVLLLALTALGQVTPDSTTPVVSRLVCLAVTLR